MNISFLSHRFARRSLAGVDESSAEEAPYKTFAATASEMIMKFYDPREIKRRAILEKRTDMNPLKLLNGLSSEDMVKRLMEKLQGVDTKNRGNVSEDVFKLALQESLAQVRASERVRSAASS